MGHPKLIISNQKEECIPRTTGLLGALGILLEHAWIQEFLSGGGGGGREGVPGQSDKKALTRFFFSPQLMTTLFSFVFCPQLIL